MEKEPGKTLYTFYETPAFTEDLAEFLGEDALDLLYAIQADLIADPQRWPIVGEEMKKENYLSEERFARLEESLRQALEHARGERHDLRTTVLPAPPKPMKKSEIVKLRRQLNLSQVLFARLLNVSVKTVQAWEDGLREPSDAALKLLTIVKKHPEVLLV